MEQEQLQAIKERSQVLLDDGIVFFRQDIVTNLELVAEVERLQQALESIEKACYGENGYLEIANIAHQALEGEQND